MTPDKTPTDVAELEALLLDHLPASKHYIEPVKAKIVAAMQAAIAKWGSPVVAGEPVAWQHRMKYTAAWVECSKEFHDWVLRAPHEFEGDEVRALCLAAPQPTQAQAGAVPQYRLLQSGVDRIEAADEFLSDDTTTWAIDPKGIFEGNIYGGQVLRPARRRFKGGQHG
ncbi:MAG: hypothetical protein ACK4OE_04580 [Acidovorax sp.]|uniref:hypothetical protein n=1 Tax=Acidovorax sp. TaxID=1872122 RepID=UPI00391888C4